MSQQDDGSNTHQAYSSKSESQPARIRSIRPDDYESWRPLWDGYNAFYGRTGPTALREEITHTTWTRFLDPNEPVNALVAEGGQGVVGFAHYLFHQSTTRIHPVCYLQDLFTAVGFRRQGVARVLIQTVFSVACEAGCSRVYWQTQAANHNARALYDKLAEHRGFIVYVHELKD